MANDKLSWTLRLQDLVSKPAKAMRKVMDDVSDSFRTAGKDGERSTRQINRAIKEANAQVSVLAQEYKNAQLKMKELTEQQQEFVRGSKQWKEVERDIVAHQRHLDNKRNSVMNHGAKVRQLQSEAEEARGRRERQMLDFSATKWNQLTEVVEKFARALDFAENYKDIEGKIQHMTNQTGKALTNSTRDVYKLSKVYKTSGDDIANTANAISKAYGVSFDEAVDKIEEGYKKGANLSGGMLGTLKEYGPLMQEMGYSLDDFIARMAHADKEGLNVSKSFQALSQGSVALKKMTEGQKAALEGIGLFPDDLKGKTIKEAMEMVGGALDAAGSTVQDKQKLLSSLFRMQGERMGNGLVTALFDSTDNLEDMPVVEEAGAQIKGFMADVQSWLADTMGGVAIGLQQLAPVFTGVGSAITLFQTLSKATMFQTVATKALSVATGILNVVAMAGPWGWIALAIGAVIAAVVLLANKFEWAAGIVEGVKNSFKDFGKLILDVILLPVRQILATFGALGKAIKALFDGRWSDVSGAFDGLNKPGADLTKQAKKAGKAYSEGYNSGVDKFKSKKESKTSTTGPDSVNEVVKVDFEDKVPELCGGSKAGGGSSKSGMGISGSGSGRGLVMNLNIVNNFNGRINSREDIRELAEEVMGVVVDRGRDFVLSI